jgi:spore coat polysaccharide biosynthesis predicted glycosyltransferase SpsG
VNSPLSVLFRCDGSPEIGLGHVVRCVALANCLKETHDCRITFAMRNGPLGLEMVRQHGYPVSAPMDADQSLNYGLWLGDVISTVGAQILVLDVRDDLSRATVSALREHGILIVTLDDPSDRRLAADLAFYPPVPQVQRLKWDGFTGQLYTGWEWVVLRREFAQRPPRPLHVLSQVLVTMGGSDPAGLTLKTINALDMLDEDFETVLVLGPGFAYHEGLGHLLGRSHRHFELWQNARDMSALMTRADLAVASFGVTAYELAAMSIPSIFLCLTEDHVESASAFVEAGTAVCLGVFSEITKQGLAQAVKFLLSDASERLRMAGQARERVDGQGAMRIAHIMAAKVRHENGCDKGVAELHGSYHR